VPSASLEADDVPLILLAFTPFVVVAVLFNFCPSAPTLDSSIRVRVPLLMPELALLVSTLALSVPRKLRGRSRCKLFFIGIVVKVSLPTFESGLGQGES
jgi:hypothetical protein